jgi:hypothetical protein
LNEVAIDAKAAQGSHQIADRIVTQLPNANRGTFAVPPHQLADTLIGFLQQQRRTGGGAAAPDTLAFDEDNRYASLGKCCRRQGARHPAADDDDVGRVVSTE